MTHFPSNFTAREYFNLHGTLPPDKIDEILTGIDKDESRLHNIQCDLEYAIDMYPDDKFLNDAIKLIRDTIIPAINDHSENPVDMLNDLIDHLEWLASTISYNIDEGTERIKNILNQYEEY